MRALACLQDVHRHRLHRPVDRRRRAVLAAMGAFAWVSGMLFVESTGTNEPVLLIVAFVFPLVLAGTTVFAGDPWTFRAWTMPLLVGSLMVVMSGGLARQEIAIAAIFLQGVLASEAMHHVTTTFVVRTLLSDHRNGRLLADLQDSHDALEHQATHDPLTGLMNRPAFLATVERSIDEARASGGNGPALLFVDLDCFKEVNDTFGHAAGDLVLVASTRRLDETVRPGDVCARLGGDEFVVLLGDPVAEEEAVRVGERLIEALERPVAVGDEVAGISASVGLSLMEGRGSLSGAELLTEADAAMYQAKDSGRRRVALFDKDAQTRVDRALKLERSLQRALADGDLRAYGMPLVSLETGLPTGVELLVRWLRPGHGVVPPAEFIGAAEASGLIIDIDRWMFAQAAGLLRTWSTERNLRHLTVAVNASARILDGDLLPGMVAAVLGGFDPSLLTVELTETAAMADIDRSSRQVVAVRAMGVHVAMDDFGTGYSSLTHLQRLTVDHLKIDRSFTSSVVHDRRTEQIVSALVTLTHAFGMKVVAEGVETLQQLDALRMLRCDVGQGYLFAPPRPIEDLTLELQERPLFVTTSG
jgi:diguanylate cyclase (GGDEF)-like protein